MTRNPLRMVSPDSILYAQEQFPRGLFQPEGSFRFSMDALLLAAFATSGSKVCHVADLGSGCGVIAFAMLLSQPSLAATGIEQAPELVEAAIRNSETLGLSSRFTAVQADLATVRTYSNLVAESFDCIVTNPPYRRHNQGRHSATEYRTNALFETAGQLSTFIEAGAYLLKNKGRFCCIFPAERLTELIAALTVAKLEPKLLRMIHSKPEKDATLVLLEARKNGNPGCTVASPLYLYEGQGNNTKVTDQALAFCPHLACNARGR